MTRQQLEYGLRVPNPERMLVLKQARAPYGRVQAPGHLQGVQDPERVLALRRGVPRGQGHPPGVGGCCGSAPPRAERQRPLRPRAAGARPARRGAVRAVLGLGALRARSAAVSAARRSAHAS